MSDFGLITLKFSFTSDRLLDFNHALDLMRNTKNISQENIDDSKVKLLDILTLLHEVIEGDSSKITVIDAHNIIEILKQKHKDDWQEFVTQITNVIDKLNESRPILSARDIDCLDDVADAIDAECAHLFRRISNRS